MDKRLEEIRHGANWYGYGTYGNGIEDVLYLLSLIDQKDKEIEELKAKEKLRNTRRGMKG